MGRRASVLARAIDARAFPCAAVEVGTPPAPLLARGLRRAHLRPRCGRGRNAATRLRPRVADQGRSRRPRSRCASSDAGALDLDASQSAAGWRELAGRRSRRRDHARSARALLRPARAPASLRGPPRPHANSRPRSARRRSSTRRARSRSTAIWGSCCSASSSRTPAARSLAEQFDAARDAGRAASARLQRRRARGGAHTAPTEIERWRGRLLVGEVHDLNAWALGGEAGHAGLFGSASAVGAFARLVLAALRGRRRSPRARRDGARVRASRRRAEQHARARLGHDEVDLVVRHAHVARRRSATPASPARRCGSTGNAISTPCCSPIACIRTPSNDAILRVRPAFHDALVDAWTVARVVGPIVDRVGSRGRPSC